MKRILRALCGALLALCVLASMQLCAFAADYEDGTYTVPFSMSGLGRHNIAWNTATVEVENGSLYVTFTLERVDPRDHAPQYDWVETSLGKVVPTINDEAFTCTFSHVPVPSLGEVEVSAQTSAMSQPYAIDYTINVSDEGIPLKAEPTPEPLPEPTPVPTPEPPQEPAAEPDDAPAADANAAPENTPIAPAPTEEAALPEEAPSMPSPTPGIEPEETAEPAETEAPASAEPETDEPAASEAPAPESPEAEAPAPAPVDGEPAEEVNTNVGTLVAILAAIVAAAAVLITVITKKGKGK